MQMERLLNIVAWREVNEEEAKDNVSIDSDETVLNDGKLDFFLEFILFGNVVSIIKCIICLEVTFDANDANDDNESQSTIYCSIISTASGYFTATSHHSR